MGEPLVFEISLDKRRRTRLASFSLTKLMLSVVNVVVAKVEVMTSANKLLTRFLLRWMVSTATPVSLPLPQLTELIFLIKLCCDQDDSIVRSLSISLTSRVAKEFLECTPVASPWNLMSISKPSVAELLGIPVLSLKTL